MNYKGLPNSATPWTASVLWRFGISIASPRPPAKQQTCDPKDQKQFKCNSRSQRRDTYRQVQGMRVDEYRCLAFRVFSKPGKLRCAFRVRTNLDAPTPGWCCWWRTEDRRRKGEPRHWLHAGEWAAVSAYCPRQHSVFKGWNRGNRIAHLADRCNEDR